MMRVLLICLALMALAAPSRAATVIACQDANGADWPVSPAHPCPTAATTTPSPLTIVPLDAATVVTGGTAVTALAAGHRTAGGWLQNPSTATVNLCINEVGTASGAVSAGSTTCIVPGQSYTLIASGNAVSVIASDAAHGFSGYGLQ